MFDSFALLSCWSFVRPALFICASLRVLTCLSEVLFGQCSGELLTNRCWIRGAEHPILSGAPGRRWGAGSYRASTAIDSRIDDNYGNRCRHPPWLCVFPQALTAWPQEESAWALYGTLYGGMTKTTVYLNADTVLALRRMSKAQGRSQADLIRNALEAYTCDAERPLPRGMGRYDSGETNGAEGARDFLRSAAKKNRWQR
jgi:hypothetical protein